MREIYFQIHPSNELPQIQKDSGQHAEIDSILLSAGNEYFIEITPHGQTITSQFREMSYNDRNCLVSTEISNTSRLKVSVAISNSVFFLLKDLYT